MNRINSQAVSIVGLRPFLTRVDELLGFLGLSLDNPSRYPEGVETTLLATRRDF
jgi:hypothetical protein